MTTKKEMKYTVIPTLWRTFQVIYKNEVITETKSEKSANRTAKRMEETL